MNLLRYSVFLILCFSSIANAEIKYQGQVVLTENTIAADIHILPNQSLKIDEDLVMVINQNVKISSLTCSKSENPIKFNIDLHGEPGNTFLPSSRKILFDWPILNGKYCNLEISYMAPIDKLNYFRIWETDSAGVEMGLYSAWYPVLIGPSPLGIGPFSVDLNVTVPEKWGIASNAVVESLRMENTYKLKRDYENFDLVLFAGPNVVLESMRYKEVNLNISYMKAKESITSIAETSISALEYMEVLNGNLPSKINNRLQFLITPRVKGPSYSRGNFWALTTSDNQEDTTNLIFHETAHFWWNKAETSTWEDWLNESFAEYTSWLARSHFSGSKIKDIVDKNRSKLLGLPEIYNLSRKDPKATAVLYIKGPVILFDLHQKIGDKKFKILLKKLQGYKELSTSDLLIELQALTTHKNIEWFKKSLGM
ncbi:gluzincin family metallopeptidase [Microbulbifer sp. 2201CG32-9]|uniref:hypothetical protein n=1 Tax=Microbulbifer sp. 2201CG32-9 TaxID=3232309 RepID=UPI00345BE3FE